MTHQIAGLNALALPANPTFYYPTNYGNALELAGTTRMTETFAGTIFGFAQDKDAIIRSIRIGKSAVTPTYELIEAATANVVWVSQGDRLREPDWLCGPDGFRLFGGFYLQVSGTIGADANISIVYDVV